MGLAENNCSKASETSSACLGLGRIKLILKMQQNRFLLIFEIKVENICLQVNMNSSV